MRPHLEALPTYAPPSAALPAARCRQQRSSLCVAAYSNEKPSWNERLTKGAAAFFSAALISGVSSSGECGMRRQLSSSAALPSCCAALLLPGGTGYMHLC